MTRFVGSVGVAALFLASGVRAQVPVPEPAVFSAISVQGRGEVKLAANTAFLTLGVQTQGAETAKIVPINAALAARVIGAVRAQGVADSDIETYDFSVEPRFGIRSQRSIQTRVITGYTVTNRIRVTVRKIANASRVLDASVKAGANVAPGIEFGLDADSVTKARLDAATKAVAQAQQLAKAIANAAGASRIALVSLNVPTDENSSAGEGYPGALGGIAGSAAYARTPLLPGRQSVVVVVEARYRVLGFADIATNSSEGDKQ